MSRTRLIRPEFYADEIMASAALATRYVYIGLWTLCDDAGYFDVKPHQIAASLFPYDSPARRQRLVDKALAELVALLRVRYLDCGVHGVVPTIPLHGAKGGNKAETYLARHRSVCMSGLVRTRTDKSSSVSVSDKVESGADALREAATRAGGFAATLAKK